MVFYSKIEKSFELEEQLQINLHLHLTQAEFIPLHFGFDTCRFTTRPNTCS